MDHPPTLIIFDLDGTLAPSKQPMTPDMGALVARLLARIPVAIMSGGSFAQFQKQFFPALPVGAALERLYIFPDSAAQCYMFEGDAWEAKYDEHFTPEERQKVMGALERGLSQELVETPTHLWGERIEDRGAEITFSALGQQAPIEEKRKWDPTREKRRPLYEFLLRELSDFSVAMNATTSIDITRKGISKAYGVRQLAEMTSIAIQDMLYVGDALEEGGNDAVVKETGIPTRPVTGPEETKSMIEELV